MIYDSLCQSCPEAAMKRLSAKWIKSAKFQYLCTANFGRVSWNLFQWEFILSKAKGFLSAALLEISSHVGVFRSLLKCS